MAPGNIEFEPLCDMGCGMIPEVDNRSKKMEARLSLWRFAILGSRDDLSEFFPNFGKRILDISIVLLILPMAVPTIFFFAFIIRLTGSSAFFGHRRVGRHGKLFTCWKLRTMHTSSDFSSLVLENPELKKEWCQFQKLKNDPRITEFGKFLRKSSFDELPQIWNILRGDMSLVGPRPITVEELPRYGSKRSSYLALRPGLTGAWQVSKRNTCSFSDRAELDANYLKNISLSQDISILLRTFSVVLSGTGL